MADKDSKRFWGDGSAGKTLELQSACHIIRLNFLTGRAERYGYSGDYEIWYGTVLIQKIEDE